MPIFGFDSVGDMFDGGGAGARGGPSSFKGSSFEGMFGGEGTKKSGGNDLLSGLGSLVGLALGGPAGAAIGAGLGNLIGGGSVGSSLQAGLGSFATSKLGGVGGALLGVLGGGGSPQSALSQLTGGLIPDVQAANPNQPNQKKQQPGGLMGLLSSPLVMAALLKATEPKNVNITTPEQRRQLETGERLPDYRGTPTFDYRYGSNFAKGGMVEGPGNGTSDSVRARIYQGGRPVQEARLSDGEFVMTNRAVRGAGGGDRAKGAAEMYRMMQRFERRA